MAPINDTLEILNKVNEFYDSAWNKLIIIGSLIGVVIPLIIHWYQQQSLKVSEKELENTINSRIIEAKKLIEEEISKELSEKLKEFERKIEIATLNSTAQVFHIQANNLREKGRYKNALRDYIRASNRYIDSNEQHNLKQAIAGMSRCLDFLKNEDIEYLESVQSISLLKCLNKIIAIPSFKSDIEKIKAKLHAINKSAVNNKTETD